MCVFWQDIIFLNTQSINTIQYIFFNFETKLKFILYALIYIYIICINQVKQLVIR